MSFPTPANTAPQHQRYVGLFYYSRYWRSWDKIIAIKDNWWHVQAVDLDGNPIGRLRKHLTPMHANMFADKPFKVQA